MIARANLSRFPVEIRNFTRPQIRHRPNFGYQRSFASAAMPLQISEGQDEGKVSADVRALVEEGGWELDDEQISVQKTYYFKTYTKVLDFHHCIGVRSKSKNHHPEMTSKSGSLKIQWTTHNPRGLSDKDTFMAKYCDEQASTIGTVDPGEAQRCGPGKPMKV